MGFVRQLRKCINREFFSCYTPFPPSSVFCLLAFPLLLWLGSAADHRPHTPTSTPFPLPRIVRIQLDTSHNCDLYCHPSEPAGLKCLSEISYNSSNLTGLFFHVSPSVSVVAPFQLNSIVLGLLGWGYSLQAAYIIYSRNIAPAMVHTVLTTPKKDLLPAFQLLDSAFENASFPSRRRELQGDRFRLHIRQLIDCDGEKRPSPDHV